MSGFLTLWSGMLSDLCTFLLTEPICYFMGGFLLMMVISIVKKLTK